MRLFAKHFFVLKDNFLHDNLLTA